MMSVLLVLTVAVLLARLYSHLHAILMRRADLLDDKLGPYTHPDDDGLPWNMFLHSGYVLGGTGLTPRQVTVLWVEGKHLLVDMKCQLCFKVLPEPGEPCAPRRVEPPPIELEDNDIKVCEYCLGDGCYYCDLMKLPAP